MRSFFYILVFSLLSVSCSNYDLLMKRAIPSYMKKGAKIVNYCDPATEENHFLIYQYDNGLFVNYLDKDRNTSVLMRESSEFVVYDYSAKIDNESFQFVVDTLIHAARPLSAILGCNLKSTSYTRTKVPYEFFMSGPEGSFLFDLRRPERLIRFNQRGVQLKDDMIICEMEGDLRDYVWEDPVRYIKYYLEPQAYRVIATFDLDGRCLSFSDLVYHGIRISDPLFIDERLSSFRDDIDSHYEAALSQEEQDCHERLFAKAGEEAIPVSSIIDSFTSSETGGVDMDKVLALYCKFSSIEDSDRPDYRYRLKYVHSTMTTLYLYTNDEAFLSVEYPAELNVFGRFCARRINGDTSWSVNSDLLFDGGIFAGMH